MNVADLLQKLKLNTFDSNFKFKTEFRLQTQDYTTTSNKQETTIT
uniref:Uncharacterized protein n=1 Tax=Rhizophora mucronata TaxID=61149 RepID=A0A2P2MX43_RHIMU